MSLLIITLPLDCASPTALFDYVQSPDGSTVSAHASVPLTLLPTTPTRLGEVVLLLPARALSWHQVQLPQGSLPRQVFGERGTARLRAILDGLLEDQLLDEPAQYHLALQPQADTSAPVWVVACARSWLEDGLRALAQADHVVTRIVPEFSVQALADTIYVTEQAQAAQLVGLLRQGSASHASTGVLVTTLSATTVSLLEATPAPGDASAVAGLPACRVVAEPAVAAQAEALFHRPVELQQKAQRLLQAAQTRWDLAQFALARTGRNRRWRSLSAGLRGFAAATAWRAARWSLLALFAVNLLGLNALAWREQANLQAQRQHIRSVLTDTFPKIPVVVDAPLQMAREVALLQRSRGNPASTDLESILASFSALAPDGYALTAIEYAANELRLTGPQMDPKAASKVLDGLKTAGLNGRLQGDQWLIGPGAAR